YLWAGLLELAVAGVFAFGVARLLHRPLSLALRATAGAFLLVFLVVGIGISIGVVTWEPNPTPFVAVSAGEDFDYFAQNWGSGAGGAGVPLAFAAAADVHASELDSPLEFQSSDDTSYTRLPGLNRYLHQHSRERLLGLAG